MGIFDGYLLMSDIDGTFEKHLTYPMPQANIDAIKYFTANGGKFAFATGRMSDYLKQRGLEPLINAPCCQCNGAFVYDYEKELALYLRKLPLTVSELAEIFLPYKEHIKEFIVPIGTEFGYHTSVDINNLPKNIRDKHPVKQVIVTTTVEAADMLLKELSADPRLKDCYVCKSWETGVEILAKNATKGEAIDFIKEYCGCHTSVGIGDFGNDIPLITHADIGVAVGDGDPSLVAVSDMTVCSCEQNAVADLIYKLEQKIKSEE